MDAPLKATHADAAWSLPHRIAFRFTFAYAVLYFFPLPAGISDPEWVSGLTEKLWTRAIPWFAARVLHLSFASTVDNGSGDKPYDYLRVACFVALALIATVVWSILDRRRGDYRALHAWARVWLRYALAFAMITYGMVKVIKLQFPTPSRICSRWRCSSCCPTRSASPTCSC